MSKQQRDAIDAAMRAEPFDLSQSPAEHRKSFEALMLRPYPGDVSAADVTLGGVGAIELTVAGHAAEPQLDATNRTARKGKSVAWPAGA
jgi:hypothetical protein